MLIIVVEVRVLIPAQQLPSSFAKMVKINLSSFSVISLVSLINPVELSILKGFTTCVGDESTEIILKFFFFKQISLLRPDLQPHYPDIERKRFSKGVRDREGIGRYR